MCDGQWILLRGRRGAVAIEYALMLVLIAAAVIGAGLLIADASRNAFQAAVAQAGDKNPSNSGQEHRTGQPVEETLPPASNDGLPLGFTLLLVILFGVLGVTYLKMVRAARVRATISPTDEPQAEVPEGDLFQKRQAIWNLLADDKRNLLENRMTVRHVMTTDLLTVAPSAPIAEVAAAIKTRRCRHVLVCSNERLVGIISDRDLRGRIGPKAADIMTHTPVTVTADTSVFQAINTMIKKSISCLPVVDEAQLLGVVTTIDLLMTLQCSMRMLQQAADGLANVPNRGRRITDLIAAEQEIANAATEAMQPEATAKASQQLNG